MEIRKVLVLRGPNIWARFPVLEAWVDLGTLKDSSSDELPGFNERLTSWLPTMIEHRCSVGTRGGFFERLRRGTYLAHILEHVTLELQQLCGVSVGFGRTRETDDEGVYKVAIRYREETLGIACLHEARELCLAAVYDRPYDVTDQVARLRSLADDVCLGPSTSAIVAAAEERGIPTRRMNQESLVQLGYGARQRRIRTAESDRTSSDCGIDRLRQAADKTPAGPGRDSRARRPPRHQRGRCLGSGLRDRLAGRRQTVRRKPRSRRGDEPPQLRTDQGGFHVRAAT